MALMAIEIGFSTGQVNGYLTGNVDVDARSFYRAMLQDVLDRIEQRLKAVGLSATAASLKAGLGEDAIRNMRRAVKNNDRKGVSTRTIQLLAPVLETSPSWLLEGVGSEDDPTLVRIIGRVGANPDGEIVMTTAQEAYDFVPLPAGFSADSVALEVAGHSMRGFADDGSLIYFEEQRTPPTPDMIGEAVVLETADGRVLVKRLLRGSAPGLYDLESINGPLIHDVRVVWAAEITARISAKQARKIIRRGGMEAA